MKSSGTYVIGHINPDTDAIASALGYAWLLQERDGSETTAARAGHLNPQTTWVFDQLQLVPPRYLPDASPRFAQIAHRYDTTTPKRPLRDVWAIANKTGGVAPVLNLDGTPYGLLSVTSLFNFLQEKIGAHQHPRLRTNRRSGIERPAQTGRPAPGRPACRHPYPDVANYHTPRP